jgi:hypothetical protein
MRYEKRFNKRDIASSYEGSYAFHVEAWLRELGLPMRWSVCIDHEAATKRIQAALEAANWECYSWDDPKTDEFVVVAISH